VVADRFPGSVDPGRVATNIVRFEHPDPAAVLTHLGREGVLAAPGSATTVRLVTHADVDDTDVERAVDAIASVPDVR
jgi:threonine aldolase